MVFAVPFITIFNRVIHLVPTQNFPENKDFFPPYYQEVRALGGKKC